MEHKWIIEQVIELFSPALAAGVAIWVAYKGYKHGLLQLAENHKQDFKIKMFETLVNEIDKATTITSKYNATLGSLLSNIEMDFFAQLKGENKIAWKLRVDKINKDHFDSLKAITKLTTILESNIIIEPKILIFQKAFGSVHYDLMDFYSKNSQNFYDYTNKDIVLSGNEVQTIPPSFIDEKEFSKLKLNIKNATEILMDFMCYMIDLRIEAQHLLLGDIFSNRITHRKPLDPSKKVISIENYDELFMYFENETASGKNQRIIEKEVLENLKNNQS